MPDSRTDDAMGLVLAGGRSSRFGRDKALMPVDGVPMAERVYQALAAVIRDVRIGLSRAGERNPVPGAEVVLDDPPGVGPMGSLRAALLAAGPRWVLAAACDMPGLTPSAVRALLSARTNDADVVVAVDPDGRAHPLAAAWHPRVIPALVTDRGGPGRSLTGLLATVRVVTVSLAPEVLRNVNRPEDLAGGSGL
jgi:molybdopterin-guanine dinucleotide biosynthesis protein A